MNNDVDAIITNALNSLGVDVERNRYTGSSNEFITFQIIYAHELDFSDDENSGTEFIYGVDVYSKSNFIVLMRRTICKLKESDFYEITISPEDYESETGYYHIPIEAKYYEEVRNKGTTSKIEKYLLTESGEPLMTEDGKYLIAN